MPVKLWSFGDRVVHAAKPEWGPGVVTSAARTSQNGVGCQMLTIRFERAGLKTLSTAYADLVTETEGAPLAALARANAAAENGASGPGGKPLESDDEDFRRRLHGVDPKEVMTRLPDAATDPFTSGLARLRATIGLYKFSKAPVSIMDWAVTQTGVADPMTLFNRHELERFFDQFVFVRDGHMKKLVQELRKQDPSGLARELAAAPASAQQAMRRVDGIR